MYFYSRLMPFVFRSFAAVAVVVCAPTPVLAADDVSGRDFRKVADEELELTARERSTSVLATPATVRPVVEAVESPITYKALQIGFSVSSLQPQGQGRVEGLEPFSLDELEPHPLLSLELRWQPYELPRAPGVLLGGFASAGYTYHDLDLSAPTGAPLPESKLHTVKALGGIAGTYRWPGESRWSAGALLGMGVLSSVQASRSSLAESAASLPIASLALIAQNRVARKWTVYGGYELRQPLQPETDLIAVARHNLVIGILGSVR